MFQEYPIFYHSYKINVNLGLALIVTNNRISLCTIGLAGCFVPIHILLSNDFL